MYEQRQEASGAGLRAAKTTESTPKTIEQIKNSLGNLNEKMSNNIDCIEKRLQCLQVYSEPAETVKEQELLEEGGELNQILYQIQLLHRKNDRLSFLNRHLEQLI